MKGLFLLSADQQKACFEKLYAVAHEGQILVLQKILYHLGVEQAFQHITSGCEPMEVKERQVLYNALHYIKQTAQNN